VRITVLGKSPAWQDAGGACSGYLVQERDFVLLLECGNGVFAKLREVLDYVDVAGVLITHMHADHFIDLIPFGFALRYSPRGLDARPSLYVPRGAIEAMQRITGSWGDEGLIENAFATAEYDEVQELAIGPLTVRFREVPHYTRAYAVEISVGETRFTYSSDCGPNDELVEFAQATDLLVIEATLAAPEPDRNRGHLTPAEAGDVGRRAGARRLVVTHFSDELDRGWVRDQAEAAYGAPVELAQEGSIFTLQ
jgi:ribonuclease BN (tRNA processing enzyme)